MRKLKNTLHKVAFPVVLLLPLFMPIQLSATVQTDDSLRLYAPESDPLMRNFPDIQNNISFLLSNDHADTEMLVTGERQIINHPALSKKEREVTYDFPIVQNHSVDRQIFLFQTALREQIAKGLSRVSRYFMMIHEILEELNLPKDLVFLPLIESNFSTHAVSRAKATGPWQFIKGTARRYGLRMDQWVDERRDPVKSTRAAAAYLKDLHKMFDSWLFSLASYNAGENRIGRAIIKTRSADFWELRASGEIPRETQNYVPKFMAATIIAKNPEMYGFSSINYELPLRYDEIKIAKQTPLHLIAKATGISIEEIKMLNPELLKETTPPHYPDYLLKLPPGNKKVFRENIAKIKTSQQHRVKWGETIGSIARKHNVSVKELRELNHIPKNGMIRAESLITIPLM